MCVCWETVLKTMCVCVLGESAKDDVCVCWERVPRRMCVLGESANEDVCVCVGSECLGGCVYVCVCVCVCVREEVGEVWCVCSLASPAIVSEQPCHLLSAGAACSGAQLLPLLRAERLAVV